MQLLHDPHHMHPYFTVLLQELLLRHCRAALHGWHRTAALESKRAHMLADHMRKAHTLQAVRLSFRAWRQASEVATAQSSFIIQSLAEPERAVLTAALRGWKARCQLRHRANAFRWIQCFQMTTVCIGAHMHMGCCEW